MAISPRWDFMEIKETFWQNIVIEEQAISVLQNKKKPAMYEWARLLFWQWSKSENGISHPGLNFCFGVTFDKEENFMHEIVLVFGWDATEFYIFAAKLLYQRFFPQGLQGTRRQI